MMHHDPEQPQDPARRSRVSAVITTYNYANFVADAIESVLCQTDPVDEIIVVDDGSTDNTRDVISSLNVPRLRYIWQQNQGAGGARNRGLSEASSEFIAYLDADDRWLPGKIEAQRTFLDSHPRIAMVTGGKWRLEVSSGDKKLEPFRPRSRSRFLDDLYIHNHAGNPSMAMVRKDVAAELGGFNTDLRWGQDWDFFIRLIQRHGFAVMNEPVIVYRWHRENLTHQRRWERADVLFSISQRSIHEYAGPLRRPWLLARASSQRDAEKGEFALSKGSRSTALRLAAKSFASYPFERTRTKLSLLTKAMIGPSNYRALRRRFSGRGAS
ncbi:MAG: glycosyltransferase family A protein [Thermomicrobiales bacterium]